MSLWPAMAMSSAATRNKTSPAITRSLPSRRRPEKIDTASPNAPVRTAYSKDRVRWLISPATAVRRRCSEAGSFPSAAASVRAWSTGRGARFGGRWRAGRTAADRARKAGGRGGGGGRAGRGGRGRPCARPIAEAHKNLLAGRPRRGPVPNHTKASYPGPSLRAPGRPEMSTRVAFWRKEAEDAAAEKHAQPGLLSDFILGSQDGLVNVLGVILGVAVASRDITI